LAPKLNLETGRTEEDTGILDRRHKIYSEKPIGYTLDVFEDVGRAFCIGLLDFTECNPISRVPSSTYKTIEAIKSDLIAHHHILIPKKRED